MYRPLLLVLFLLLTQITHAADYYWVGGNGNWSDISHWATTSGGVTRHNVVPGANDRVFFDPNSFTGPNQSINVNNQSIFCLDMNWEAVTNNPTFTAPGAYVMNVYGSLRLSANMTFAFHGAINFLATTNGHTINMAGHRIQKIGTFAGLGGGWTLAAPLQLDTILMIQAGSLNTGNQAITCLKLFVIPSSPVSLNLGNSHITVTGRYNRPHELGTDTAVVELNRTNLTIVPGNSILELNSNKPLLRVLGFGAAQLGTVLFSNTSGLGKLESELGGVINMLRLDLRSNSQIQGSASFDELILSPGKNFNFQAGFSYTLKKLVAPGECSKPIQIFSSIPGTRAIFESIADSITGNFLSLKDILGQGRARFVARNAADLGNNTGWTFIPKANSNLYWVGGSGNWNDLAHWALSSGGTGGACLPTAVDNVIFDANSGNGFTVNIDLDNAYCRSMDWTGALGFPSLAGSQEKALHIYGSLTFIPDMRQEFQGQVGFEGDNQGNLITSAGKIFQNNVTISGDGSWSLADSLSVKLDLFFAQGSLDTKGQRVFTRNVYSQPASTRKLTLGKTHWVLRQNSQDLNPLFWDVNAKNMTLEAGSSTIEFRNAYASMNCSTSGASQVLNYNIVWFFGGDGVLNTHYRTGQHIDSLKCVSTLYLHGPNNIGVLEMMNPNNRVRLNVGDTLTVKEILTPDVCTGMVEILSSSPTLKAYIRSAQALTVRRLMLADINYVGVGPAIANNSIDLGGNQGWTINEVVGRDLYWVGKNGNGDWYDPANWSLSSGGPGGACIPTAKDDVFFDVNSFNGPGQRVTTSSLEAYCHNMIWTGVDHSPYFYLWSLNAFGSLELSPSYGIISSLILRSSQKNETIKTQQTEIGTLSIRGSGGWILQDSLKAFYIYHSEGDFDSNSKKVKTNVYQALGPAENNQNLKLGSSHWIIGGNGAQYSPIAEFGDKLTLDAGTSLLEFTNTSPSVYVKNDLTFHNVLFSNHRGTSLWHTEGRREWINRDPYIARFNRMEFRNNGIIYGSNTIDSLIFTAGKSYQLDAFLAQTINEYFQVIGNNCNPIELSSTAQGTKAEVIMNGGKVRADFVQMRDQRGVGSTQFLAGANSTDIAGSNQNWVFDSPVDYVEEGILGKDAVLCKSNSLVLDAHTFSAGETYRWSNGSTNPTLSVNQAGIYFVAVTYNDGCILRDTVRVFAAEEFTPNLGPDTTLCSEGSLVLDADLNLLGATYRWQDGSTASSYQVTQAGQYKVTVELSGCTASDSIQVRVVSATGTGINLGRDTSICTGQSLLLDAAKTGGTSFTWSDGSREPNLQVSTSGLYWVDVKDGQCTVRDSINVTFVRALGLNLGRDTSFCEGGSGSYLIRSNLGNLSYRWQDGSTNASLSVNTAGIYWLEASANGCTERDSITIRTQALPRFELGGDTILCEGTSFNLRPNLSVSGTPTYRWSNGSTNSNINVQSSGVHSVTVTVNGCTFSDQKRFTFNPGPAFELGADRGFCIGESYRPDVAITGGRYLWNTGATTSRITITQNGLYYVDVSLNGCTKRDSAWYSFGPEPKFSLGRDTILCAGESLNVNAATANATYRWNNGNTAATRTFTQTEIAWADVTVEGCRKRDSIRVQFIDLPKGILGRDSMLCEGQIRTYQINVPGATLRWQDNSSTTPYVISSPGLYILQASSGRCSVLDSVQIGYKPYPAFSLGRDTTLCNNEFLNLNPTAGGGVYRWNDGQSTAPKQLSQNGTYWLEVNLNGCVRSDTLVLRKINLPQTLLAKDTILCEGNTLRMTVQANNTSVVWQDGSNNSFFVVRQAGTYWVQVGSGRCTARDSIQIGYNPLPRFNLGKDTVMCTGETLTLTAITGADQLRWNTGATSPQILVNTGGTFWAQSVNRKCSFVDSIRVTYQTIPTVSIGPDTLVCDDKPYVLQASGHGNAPLLWSNGSTGKSLAATTPGTYWVRAYNDRCGTTDSMILAFRECVVFKAFTPNAFTPDGNTSNENFRPFINEQVQVQSYELQVFDRWGGQAFRSTDINAGWDGFIRGQKAPQGVYIYWFRIEYIDDKGPGNALIRGEVALLR